jgi:hypothetical protein
MTETSLRMMCSLCGEKVAAAREEAGFGGRPPSIEYLEVHRIVQR